VTAPEDESRILFLEAVAHHQAGRRDEAERGYREVLARNPRVVAAHTSRSGMDAIRKKLSGNLAALPLFDCARYTRDIEEAYERMVELHQSGRPPESIAIGL